MTAFFIFTRSSMQCRVCLLRIQVHSCVGFLFSLLHRPRIQNGTCVISFPHGSDASKPPRIHIYKKGILTYPHFFDASTRLFYFNLLHLLVFWLFLRKHHQ